MFQRTHSNSRTADWGEDFDETFTSPYIFHYLSLESASRWLIFAKRKKTVARVTTRCPTIHSLLSTVYVMC